MEMRKIDLNVSEESRAMFDVSALVDTAMKFKSKIMVTIGDTQMNAKSFMGMSFFSQLQGDSITVSAEGDDETAAVEECTAMLRRSLHAHGVSA